MNQNIKLKFCPFCGREPEIKQDIRYPSGDPITTFEVVCNNAGCIIYNADNRYFTSIQKAIEAWNRRV